ncbi:MAG: hypothetical protein EPN23_08040 [Verrucomicrobia bacterium]|nr:MAG: hypothetical protein EPN23_08040 [Verrucomicrobiota bacterium]
MTVHITTPPWIFKANGGIFTTSHRKELTTEYTDDHGRLFFGTLIHHAFPIGKSALERFHK